MHALKLFPQKVPTAAPRYPDDPENFAEGAVVEGNLVRRDLEDVADYVIVGSGAAGATAAYVLASAGHSVVVIEEGPWVRTRNISTDLHDGFRTLFRGAGTAVAMGRSMFPVLQGRCVGGSTTINSSIAWRPPLDVFARWSNTYGVGDTLSMAALEPHFLESERALNVRAVQDGAFGESNRLFVEAAEKKGYRAERMKRYERDCEGLGLCLTGCPHGRKMSMNVTHVPQMLRAGGRIYTSARVERVEARGGRARSVRATFGGWRRATLRVHARKAILVAASVVQTPGILKRSGLRSRDLGRHFMTHPGNSLTGRFDRRVGMEHGATQGADSLEFAAGVGFKLETVGAPPELAALRLPGTGPALIERLMDYEHLANWAVVVRGEAEGRVLSFLGQDQVVYSLSPGDVARMRNGMKMISTMMFDMGAKEVYPGVAGMPAVLKSPDDLRFWDHAPLDPRAYTSMASHLFGTARMGPDPAWSVVGTDFQTHELPGLYVIDSSVFPTNLGVNPQHTIMAAARLAVHRLMSR